MCVWAHRFLVEKQKFKVKGTNGIYIGIVLINFDDLLPKY